MNVVKESDVELKRFPDRDLKMIISKNNVGAENIAVNIVWLKPRALTKPCHAHLDEEEVVYILEGQGEFYIDGEIHQVRQEDTIFLPKKAKHIVRNSGTRTLKLYCMLAPPTHPDKYELYPHIDFP